MFRMTESSSSEGRLTLQLAGNVSVDALPEIDRLLLDCRRNSTPVVLDLADVALMDREAVRFFAGQLRRGIELVNCPGYLEHWISREIFP